MIALGIMASAALAQPGPSPSQQALYEALSVRDPAPVCASLEPMSEQVVEDLLFLVDQASRPPWVGMRAADCLLELHAGTIHPQLRSWVSEPEYRGLGILVLDRLDRLPEELSLELASLALAGALEGEARRRLARSETPALRALVSED